MIGELKAIISDQKFKENSKGMSSVFGNSQLDGKSMKLFKKIGFSLSIFFLLLTIIIHFVIEEIRKEMSGKLIIGMSTAMTGLYICLLARTVAEDEDQEKFSTSFVSTNNPGCTALGRIRSFTENGSFSIQFFTPF